MVHKVNQKKEIKEMIEISEDIRHLSKYSRCLLSFRGFECIECGECSLYGRKVFVEDYSCDYSCPYEECNDCSVSYYHSYAYFEDDISPEDMYKFSVKEEGDMFI